MSLDRRQFLLTAATLAATSGLEAAAPVLDLPVLPLPDRPAGPLGAAARGDFPSVSLETYLNSASTHPLSVQAARAVESGLQYRLKGPGEGRVDFGAERQEALKARYARLINAKSSEIAYVANTSDGENVVVMGMDLAGRRGNVVIDELHFTTSLYMYKALEAKGVELRIVKHRDWTIPVEEMERAIDRNTRLVSMALVSNVNGFMHDAAAVSRIAHAHGAHVFADIIQAVGAVPVDVRAMGLDFASTGTYKWLMGERGLGFLYVREDLQDTVVPTTRYGHRQIRNFNRAELSWEPLPGASRYETGGIAVLPAACVDAGIAYVENLGLPAIGAHAQRLVTRLQNEIPPLGFTSLTPRGTGTPIVAFQLKDAAATAKALKDARVAATIIQNESRLRLSVSVFNTDEDIDKVIQALDARRSSSAA
jgi:selenocysteine lyase/cysteine desulfurase